METVELSYSRVQAYQRCPWMYHLIYNEGWRSGPNESMALGQSLHKTLEAFLSETNADHSRDRLLELYDQHWVNEGFAGPAETLECYERGRKMLENFFEIDKSRKNQVVATEKEFNVEITPEVQFRGTIDRLDRHPDGALEIIEYKTQRDRWTDDRVAGDMQMTFYMLGLQEENKNAEIKLKYYFFSTGESKEARRTPEQTQEVRAIVSAVADRIRRKEFSPNHAYCPRCEFGKRCVNFKRGTTP